VKWREVKGKGGGKSEKVSCVDSVCMADFSRVSINRQ